MNRTTCTVATASAAKYLQQLCKHFAHKVPAAWTEATGRIEFPFGTALLEAREDALDIVVETPEATRLDELADVVARHLARFAFRETLAFDWRATAA